MSKFYVGQRVRLVNDGSVISPAGLAGIGREGVITEMPVDLTLRYSVRTADGSEWWAHPDCMTPILDPGREVISWEAMKGLWVPDGVAA